VLRTETCRRYSKSVLIAQKTGRTVTSASLVHESPKVPWQLKR
jgi:hypothetical protein